MRTLLVIGLVALGCSTEPPTSMPLTEHRPSEVARATLRLGQDCSATGYQGCVSQLCGHFGPGNGAGYYCTRRCGSDLECPRGWACKQVYPADDGTLCVSPAGWDAGVALLRDGGMG